MSKINDSGAASSPLWESLESHAREHIEQFVQRLLEEEVEVLLGRRKSERRREETPAGYRNGYAKRRELELTSGTITVRRPRVRDLDERFVSRVLPEFACSRTAGIWVYLYSMRRQALAAMHPLGGGGGALEKNTRMPAPRAR